MGIVIPFPVRRTRASACRPPFDRVHVLPGDLAWGEWWTIAGSAAWLHGSWSAAINDAVKVAAGFGLPISIDH